MLENKKRLIIMFFIAGVLIFLEVFVLLLENNTVDALSKYGSRGEEVRQIQTKLKRWGYYNGNVDGIWKSNIRSG